MELNTEINRVFGEEMAKIFASTISEDELKIKAEEVWKQMNSHRDAWGRSKNSDIEDFIKNVLLEKLHEKILEVLQEPESEEAIELHARLLVKKARETADDAIVRSVAEGITTRTLSVWNNHEKFVMDVLNVFHTEGKKGY